MKIKINSSLIIAAVCGAALIQSCSNPQPKELPLPQTLESIGNPFMPLWEHIPDGEPYVFEDPDNPGQYRVYLYGSHDIEISNFAEMFKEATSKTLNLLSAYNYQPKYMIEKQFGRS